MSEPGTIPETTERLYYTAKIKGQKMQAIKDLRDRGLAPGISLVDAKRIVEIIMGTHKLVEGDGPEGQEIASLQSRLDAKTREFNEELMARTGIRLALVGSDNMVKDLKKENDFLTRLILRMLMEQYKIT